MSYATFLRNVRTSERTRIATGRNRTWRGRSHGSHERMPGSYFRALAVLYQRRCPQVPLRDFARRIIAALRRHGIAYHEESIIRSAAGRIRTVSPEAVAAALHILVRDAGFADAVAIDAALAADGTTVPAGDREPVVIAVTRLRPLVELWLATHPDMTEADLARTLRDSPGVAPKVRAVSEGHLRRALRGDSRTTTPRAFLNALLALLAPLGITTEVEARARWTQERATIEHVRARRTYERPVAEAVALADRWRVAMREPSVRALAVRVHAALAAEGDRISLNRIEAMLYGCGRHVRGDVLRVLTAIVQEACGDTPEGETADRTQALRGMDLRWMYTSPIIALAGDWLAQHPGVARSELATRIAQAIRRMGYRSSADSVYRLLRHKSRVTHAYVYRALFRLIHNGHDPSSIPPSFFVQSPRRAATTSTVEVDCLVAREQFLAPIRAKLRDPATAQPEHIIRFAAIRAAKQYGADRARVESALRALLPKRRAAPTAPQETRSVADAPPAEQTPETPVLSQDATATDDDEDIRDVLRHR